MPGSTGGECALLQPSGWDSALALVSHCPGRFYCSGSSLTLPLADEQRISIFPCLSANGTDVFSLAHARFDSHFHCSGRENEWSERSCGENGQVGQAYPHPASAGTPFLAAAEQSHLSPLRIWPNTSPVRSGKSEVLKSQLSHLCSETPSCH